MVSTMQQQLHFREAQWRGKLYDGAWINPGGGQAGDLEPATGSILTRVGVADAKDVHAAPTGSLQVPVGGAGRRPAGRLLKRRYPRGSKCRWAGKPPPPDHPAVFSPSRRFAGPRMRAVASVAGCPDGEGQPSPPPCVRRRGGGRRPSPTHPKHFKNILI